MRLSVGREEEDDRRGGSHHHSNETKPSQYQNHHHHHSWCRSIILSYRTIISFLLNRKNHRLSISGGVVLVVLLCLILLHHGKHGTNNNSKNNKYRGIQYWKDGVTIGYQTLYETSFARFQIHQILLEDGKTIINDWLWYDESDNINVLVEMNNIQKKSSTKSYIVLKQTKYGIDGLTYAVLGGLIEQNELPIHAAKRELQEELHMSSNEWISLGSYRAAANRGGGMTYSFLARNSIYRTNGNNNISSSSGGGIGSSNSHVEPVEGELERQEQVQLTRKELIDALKSGMFKEIKWTATVALALLHDDESGT